MAGIWPASWRFRWGSSHSIFLCAAGRENGQRLAQLLLFSTQPLFWGHAFINPKDIPFMAFFLASVSLGLYMVDSVLLLSFGNGEIRSALVPTFRTEWDVSVLKAKKGAIAFLVVFVLSLMGIVTGLSMRFVAAVVTYIYQTDRQSILGAWFAKVAPNAGHLAVSNYIHKAQVLFTYAEIIYILLCILIGIWIFSRVFPLVYRELVEIYFIPYIKGVLLNPLVLTAGFILGVATSIRVMGPLAGGIVILYGLYKSWRKSILFIPPYILIAGFATYLTWPYLWGNAVNRFIESLITMSNYPIEGVLSFRGQAGRLSKPPRLFSALHDVHTVDGNSIDPFCYRPGPGDMACL